ncbi:LOW QUALITY PROTEIN: Reverse transcriptase [Phytophthora palmivora]|uniref:Reverse transcriptase n=1 Tax=Phytophthora palmivora TaxID=4796 RepID=A0A2P4XNF8_9STRA|nr:LOW QUALITY PROTEIN: Reverse transcriptase [Phytophthora palmivora]
MDADRDKLMRLVIPETLYQDILHHYHVGSKGSIELINGSEIISTGEACIRAFKDMWANCETGKNKPQIQGESPGNL